MGLFKQKYYPPPPEMGEAVDPATIQEQASFQGQQAASKPERARSTPAAEPRGVDAGDGADAGTSGSPERSAKSAPADVEASAIAQIDTFDGHQMASLQRLRTLCKFMDHGVTVPIIGYKFGADAVLGLVPYAGDACGAMVGMYIVSRAVKYHLPKRLVAHMAVNQAIDACVGVVPFLGDLFDFGYKANYRNLQLIEAHLKEPLKAKRADSCFLFGVFFMVVVVPFLLVACIIAGIVVAILAATGKLH